MKDSNEREVWVSCGLTINLGNYESARVDAGIKLPVMEEKDLEDTYKLAWKKTLYEIEKQAKEVKQNLK